LNPSNTTIALQGRDHLSGAPTEPRQGVSPPTSWNAEPASPKLTKPANGGQRRRFTPRRPDPNAEHQFDEFDPHLQHNKTSTPVAIIRAGDKGCPSKLAARFARVKAAAKGREKEILVALTGIPEGMLDGRHGPCPKCGGDDRFRYDNQQDYAYCNRCFCTGNGDWIAAIAWLLSAPDGDDVSQAEALKKVEKYLLGHPQEIKPIVMHPSATSGNGSGKPSHIYATVDEALSVYRRTLGEPSRAWRYCDAQRKAVGYVYRWDGPDGKEIRPISSDGDGWKCGAMPAPRPRYNLPAVLKADRVYITEGEKAADALNSVGLTATTSSGGAKGARKTDWTPLGGKDIVIVPDNDEAGDEYARNVIDIVSEITGWVSVRVLNLPNLPDKGDAYDYVEALKNAGETPGEIQQRIERLADKATPIKLTSKHGPGQTHYRAVKPDTHVRISGPVDCEDVTVGSIGTVTADHGDTCDVTFNRLDDDILLRIPKTALSLLNQAPLASTNGGPGATAEQDGSSDDEPQELPTQVLDSDSPGQQANRQWAKPPPIGELLKKAPKLHAPVVHGLLRVGETANIIGSPKACKSWLADAIALAVASGRKLLNVFDVQRGNVLILDNELHEPTHVNRIPKVAEALGIDLSEYKDGLIVKSLRGELVDIYALEGLLSLYEPGELSLVIFDALYRFLPGDVDENSNSQMAQVYNRIDFYALRLNCACVCIHHTSKGSQSGKSVTDVGAGAGAQARAADTHLILRPHAEPGAVVLEAATRSWPPVEPHVLRWKFPIWELAADLDPADLKSDKPKLDPQSKVKEVYQEILGTLAQFPDATTKTKIRDHVGQSRQFDAAWKQVWNSGCLEECKVKAGNNQAYDGYRLAKPAYPEPPSLLPLDQLEASEEHDVPETTSEMTPVTPSIG